MKLFIKIDLAGYFGAECRVIDGREGIFIPFKTNRTIVPASGRAIALFHTFQMQHADADGNTMLVIPFIPKKIAEKTARADIVKMTMPIGRIRISDFQTNNAPPAQEAPTEPARTKIDHTILAASPITDDDIPL